MFWQPLVRFSVLLLFSFVLLNPAFALTHRHNRKVNIVTTDYDLVDTSYIDRGRMDGIKVGDSFDVSMRSGKMVTNVIVTAVYDRMSAVKIKDSWLLKDGLRAKPKQRPYTQAINTQERRPAPEIAIKKSSGKATKVASAAPVVPAVPAAPSLPSPDTTVAPPTIPDVTPAAPAAPTMPALPGDDMGLPPMDDVGLPPMDDGGLPPMDDGGLPPMDDGGLPPMDDGGFPPMDDGGLPPMDDGGLPPMDDMDLPPAPGGDLDVPPPPPF